MCLILWEISLSNTSSQGISSLFGFEKGKPIEHGADFVLCSTPEFLNSTWMLTTRW